jgi:hypothetical protein
MLVDPTQSGAKTLASTQVASRATANSSLFASTLAKASTTASRSLKADTSSSTDSSSATDKTSTKAPKGEKSAPVSGHSYSEITAGPRNGMFLNTSGNGRDGQAFARVRRDGREFHIYGTGKHRLIVEIKHKDASDTGTSTDTSNSTDSGSSTTTGSTAPATDTTGTPSDGS